MTRVQLCQCFGPTQDRPRTDPFLKLEQVAKDEAISARVHRLVQENLCRSAETGQFLILYQELTRSRVEDLDEQVWQQVTELLEKLELIGAELERRRQESLKSDPLERRRGQLTQELKRGVVSLLLANIMLDPLDKELEKRGLRFAHYADDFLILIKSAREGKRVLASII